MGIGKVSERISVSFEYELRNMCWGEGMYQRGFPPNLNDQDQDHRVRNPTFVDLGVPPTGITIETPGPLWSTMLWIVDMLFIISMYLNE